MEKKLAFSSPCPHCLKNNDNNWCYQFFDDSSNLFSVCKRNSPPANGWSISPYKDSENSPIYSRDMSKVANSHPSTRQWFYLDNNFNKIVKVERKDSSDGKKFYAQYSLDNSGNWQKGINVPRETIMLYNFDKLKDAIAKNIPIFITEGEKCADSLNQLGFVATTALGGSKWLPHYTQTFNNHTDTTVILVPDMDAVGLKHILKVEHQLKSLNLPLLSIKYLFPFPNHSLWQNLPPDKGLDIYDWVNEWLPTPDEIVASITDTIPLPQAEKNTQLQNSDNNDDFDKNLILIAINDLFPGNWISIDNTLYQWVGTHYQQTSPSLQCRRIWQWLESHPIRRSDNKLFLDPQPSKCSSIYASAIHKFGIDPNKVNPPGLNCQNGILSISWQNNQPVAQLTPHSPDYYFTYVSNVAYHPDADTQHCDRLLNCLDYPQQDILFKLLGASLDLRGVRKLKGRIVKAALCVGTGSNGKDSLRQCVELIFSDSLGAANLNDFVQYDRGRKFALAKLSNIKINWSSENSASYLDNVQSLKAAITGEPISMELKGKDERPMQTDITFFFNVNEPPDIKTGLESTLSRWCVIDFNKTFKVNAQPSKNEIEADPRFRYDSQFLASHVCPAFLNRIVHGLRNLISDGIDYSSIEYSITSIKERSNHLWRFCNETNLKYSPTQAVELALLWDKLRLWYISNGTLEIDSGKPIWHEQPNKKDKNCKAINQVFSRFNELFPKCEKVQERDSEGNRKTLISGLHFDDDFRLDGRNDVDNHPPNIIIMNSQKQDQNNFSSPTSNITNHQNDDTSNDTLNHNQLPSPLPPNTINNHRNFTDNYTDPYSLTHISKGKVIVDVDKLPIEPPQGDVPLPLFKPRKLVPYDDVSKCYLDIETLGLDPDDVNNRIISIGLWDGIGDFILLSHPSERQLIIQFLQSPCLQSSSIIVGHNLFKFDLPFIISRAIRHDIPLPFDYHYNSSGDGFVDRNISSSSINGKPITFTDIIWKGKDIIDTYHQLGIFDKMSNILPDYKLKSSVLFLGLRKEQRLELSFNQILEHYHNGGIDTINEYLKFDLEDTKLLADFLIPQVYYQLSVVPLPLQQLAIASPAKIWESIIEDYYRGKKPLPKPDHKLKYEGGYCWVNPGAYTNAHKIDVSSMYPSIQILYRLCSTKDTEQYYLAVLTYLKQQRIFLKDALELEFVPSLMSQDIAAKRNINGGYGFSGTGGYPYNCMRTAALVTAYGRILVKLMVDSLQSLGANIIEVDTDGIYFQSSDKGSLHDFDFVQSQLPAGISIKLELTDCLLYVPKKKNYIIYFPDGKTKTTGSFRSRSRCQLFKSFCVDYVKQYLTGGAESSTHYYDSVIKQLTERTVDTAVLKVKQRIAANSKTLVEHNIGQPGDVVTYLWSGHVSPRGAIKLYPSTGDDYLPEYYIKEIDKLKKEIDSVILPPQDTEQHKQLTLW